MKEKKSKQQNIQPLYDTTKVNKDDILKNQICFEDYFNHVDFTSGVNEDIDSIIDSEDRAKKMHDANESVSNQKSPNKKIWSFIFLVLNIIIVVVIFMGLLEGDNVTSIANLDINPWWIVGAFLLFGGIMLCEQIRYELLIRKATEKHRPFLSYKVGAVGRYYDNITPLGTGGQPFQVWYLTSRGIKASSAISIPLAKFIFQQFVLSLFSLFLLIGSVSFFQSAIFTSSVGTSLVMVACWVGFAINFGVFIATILLSTSNLGHKIVIGVLKLLAKLRIVKNYEKQYIKLFQIVEDYQRTMKFYTKSPKLLISMLFLSIVAFVAQYSIPFFIYCAFVGFDPSMWIQIMIIALMVDLAASFIPLPGGSGVSELAFTAMFATLLGGATFWALLLWRFISYYMFILQGFVVTIYDYIIGNRKNERMKKKWKEENFDVSGSSVKM